jgi:hypothetical protein
MSIELAKEPDDSVVVLVAGGIMAEVVEENAKRVLPDGEMVEGTVEVGKVRVAEVAEVATEEEDEEEDDDEDDEDDEEDLVDFLVDFLVDLVLGAGGAVSTTR